MSGEHSPKSPINPTGEDDKDKNKNDDGKPEDEKQDESSGSKGKKRKRKTRMMMTTRNQVMTRCHIENGRHGKRSKS